MIHFIVAPYHLGKRAVAVGAGPLRVKETGIASRINASLKEIDAGDACDWAEVNDRLTRYVQAAILEDAFPLVMAGNCNSCLGTLAAIRAFQPGIVWFDAHADFHTPETSISGSIEGMSLTLATEKFVAERNVILAGARDLDPGEDTRVQQRLRYVPGADLRAQTLPDMRNVYVHLDIDVLNASLSPGVNYEGPGGLTTEILLDALGFTFERYNVVALAITNYNPVRDVDDRTRDILVRIIENIAGLRRAAASR
jgi:arginase